MEALNAVVSCFCYRCQRSSNDHLYEGDNDRLRLVLYAPKSRFENDTLDDYKAGLSISVLEEADLTAEESSTGSSSNTRRKISGGLGLMSSQGMHSPRIRSLGGGWIMSFDTITCVHPITGAAADLEEFFTRIVDSAEDQIGRAAAPAQNFAFENGGYSLQLTSPDAISWIWVVNFAEGMLDSVRNQLAVLFKGEAYSTYWDIATVVAALTVS